MIVSQCHNKKINEQHQAFHTLYISDNAITILTHMATQSCTINCCMGQILVLVFRLRYELAISILMWF